MEHPSAGAQELKKQEPSAEEPAQPSSEQEQKQQSSEIDLKQSADLVGVPLGVPDGTEVIDWSAAVDQVPACTCLTIVVCSILRQKRRIAYKALVSISIKTTMDMLFLCLAPDPREMPGKKEI